MSFYGNIQAGLNKFITKITSSSPSTETYPGYLTSTITLTATDNEDSSVEIKIPELSIKKDETTTDNELKYIVRYGDSYRSEINIPLDLILHSSEVITESSEFEGYDSQRHEAGTYIHLTFKTDENVESHCYIDVTSLNEIAGEATDTIQVNVDSQQKISAKVKNRSITSDKIKEGAITSEELSSSVREAFTLSTDMLTINGFGGISAGTNLNGKTASEILNLLLFPYIDASVGNAIATPNGGTYEHGTTQTITKVQITVTKKSAPITSVALYNGSTLIEKKTGDSVKNGGTIVFSNVNVEASTDGDKLTVKVTYPDAAGNAKTVSRDTAAFTFVYPYYYGVCAEGATINEALVTSLNKKIETRGNKSNWTFTCNNQRMVFAYPAAYGNLTKIIDHNNFDITGSFTKHSVNVTGQPYYVYVNGASTVSNFAVDFNY